MWPHQQLKESYLNTGYYLLLDILFQVLQDSTVKASPTLYQQIKARREEGIRRCQSLQKKAPTSSAAATTTTTSASIDATISTRYNMREGYLYSLI